MPEADLSVSMGLGVSQAQSFCFNLPTQMSLGVAMTCRLTRIIPAFHDTRLPEDVEKGAHGGPGFMTAIAGMSSGQEQRNIDWQEARGVWDVGYGISSKDDFKAFQAFFYARRGQGYGFRFKDWSDFESAAAPGEALGLGTGVQTDFEIVKIYDPSGILPYKRRITRPVESTVVVYVNSIAISSSAWSFVYTTVNGLRHAYIHFLAAPTGNVSAVFEFDVPVRFNTDAFDLSLEWFLAGQVPSLPLLELRE